MDTARRQYKDAYTLIRLYNRPMFMGELPVGTVQVAHAIQNMWRDFPTVTDNAARSYQMRRNQWSLWRSATLQMYWENSRAIGWRNIKR